ncbi:hypothetical protein HBB16_09855 [Pseudonocardia sp. MCCB 268]|nr:hypothetical protein [Pseudonocardia cytotoxica]
MNSSRWRIGDSRIYRLPGRRPRSSPTTTRWSSAGRRGRSPAEEAAHHPHRSVLMRAPVPTTHGTDLDRIDILGGGPLPPARTASPRSSTTSAAAGLSSGAEQGDRRAAGRARERRRGPPTTLSRRSCGRRGPAGQRGVAGPAYGPVPRREFSTSN